MLGEHFAAELDRSTLEEDNNPMLGDAYLLVFEDYFRQEAENGKKPDVPNDMLALCADHYYGYCIRQSL